MSNKLTLEGLQAFKNKLDDKFSVKGHSHSGYATKADLILAGNIKTVNEQYPDENGNIAVTVPTKTSDLTNDSGYLTAHQDITGKADKSDTYTKTEVDALVSSVYKYKGSVASVSVLPSSNRVTGDVYNVEDSGANYAWNGSEWDKLSETVDLSGKADKSTTLAGYGITDAKIASGVITLGSNTITPLTSASTLDATKLSGTIPSDCYTNTTYSDATTSAHGLMTAAMVTKLNGIAASANNYSHPTSDGNKHVPATGTSNNGKFLMAGSTAGALSWGTPTNTVTTATTTGSGNAVTAITASNGALTVTKGTTFLTSHQDISGKANLSGSTFTGAVNLANSTMNKIGDDCSFGDVNVAGQFGIKGLNGNTGIAFYKYGESSLTTKKSITFDGTNILIDGNSILTSVPANAKFTDTNTVTTATTTGSGNAVTAVTASNGALTVTKGSTFLTSHQSLNASVAWTADNKLQCSKLGNRVTITSMGGWVDLSKVSIPSGYRPSANAFCFGWIQSVGGNYICVTPDGVVGYGSSTTATGKALFSISYAV